uniref:DUF538 family protein n=1 Tax=Oryza brachyantha TaxID=4533 RepID=J3LRS0_ORYBR
MGTRDPVTTQWCGRGYETMPMGILTGGGLIPDSVASYTFDEATGAFEIRLSGTCYVWFGSHLVYYEKTVRGRLTYGAIADLSGIQAKKLFLWVSVTGIVAHPDQGTVEFQVGFISEALPASQFDKVPVCGAGAQLRGAAGVIRELGLLPVAEVLEWDCASAVTTQSHAFV